MANTINTYYLDKKKRPKDPSAHLLASSFILAVSSAMSVSAIAEEVDLDTVVIEDNKVAADGNPYAEEGAPYKAKRLSDSKRVREIAKTPQTMTVLTKEAIIDSGKTELKDILSAQPGITLGTGEGGNSFGDRYIIRGYEARSDVFTDGLREPGLITRETFALEQVEITKGPSSTFAGRGSTGGAVNSVTKKATTQEDFATLDAGFGTDSYSRYSLDANKALSDELAVRMNILYSENEIADRGPAEERRQGILLSGIFSPSNDLDITADYYRFRSDDRTDTGVALSNGAIQHYDYVGQDGLDFQENEADIFTAGFKYRLNSNVTIENKTRIGETNNDYVLSTYSSGRASTRTFSGWQENDYLGNQTNVIIDTELWGKDHTFVTGIEYAREEVDKGNYTVSPDSVVLDPYNANNGLWSGTTSRNDANAELELRTISAYLMDTITLSDAWEVFAGVRYDHYDYDLWTAASNGRGGPTPEMDRSYSDSFWNGHFGVVYSPWQNGNVYASWSTSSNVNGGEADAAGSCGYGGLCSDASGNFAADPEQSTNYELGTKWNLFDQRLLLTAAVFKIIKEDVIEGSSNSYSQLGSLNTGENEVEGVEVGLSGNITDKLSGQIGAAIMDSETTKSIDPTLEGLPKANFAEKSASAQLRYQATPKFAFGGTLTYSSEMFGGQPDAGANEDRRISGYTVYDLFASYKVSENLSVRANVLNLTDKDYYTALYRGGSIVYRGDSRSANMNLTYKF